MFKSLCTLLAAFILASCGGGGGASPGNATLASSVSSALSTAGKAPDPTLAADPVSVVNTTTAGEQVLRTVGAASDGGYIVAWLSDASLFIQAYDSDGAKTGAETTVPLLIAGLYPAVAAQETQQASVAVLDDGSVVVVYRASRSTDQPNGAVLTKTGVYFQRFDAHGVQLMGETEVFSLEQVVYSRSPVLATFSAVPLSDGGFVVGWSVNTFSAQFGFYATVGLRWFDSQGQPVGSPVEVGQLPQLAYSIVADNQGGFVLSLSQMDNNFRTEYSVFHYDAGHAFQEIVNPRFDRALLLPLRDGYVRFEVGADGPIAQRLDLQGTSTGAARALPGMPLAARELADGSYVALWQTGGGFTVQRFDAGAAPMGEAQFINTQLWIPQMVSLQDTGFVAAWSMLSNNGDMDVYAQRFTQTAGDPRKACLDSARAQGLRGMARQAFMRACMG